MGADPENPESSAKMQKNDLSATAAKADDAEASKGYASPNIAIIMKGLSVILLLIALTAIAQLYFSIQNIIAVWLDEEYVPIANSIYYIAVIAGCIFLIFRIQSPRFGGK